MDACSTHRPEHKAQVCICTCETHTGDCIGLNSFLSSLPDSDSDNCFALVHLDKVTLLFPVDVGILLALHLEKEVENKKKETKTSSKFNLYCEFGFKMRRAPGFSVYSSM